MRCYECKWLDRSVILTSIPPQYRCTLGFGSHYADHECEYDFMPIVRCKDCTHRHTDDCPMYHEEWYEIDEGDGYFDSDFTVHDYSKDDGFCSCGERKKI